ncbi:uncharacterized protein LOC132561280 [Ylistrum balloti]|uniref:uncharacterized protein LOC132561280 n=1 Tax=Ylistrum balloti TaxID=509963 RepID=UPI002905BD5B|nr:uncharacterized protein LOC132561280 [Ylistrum balloti]
MLDYTGVFFLILKMINLSSGEPCAHDVNVFQNMSGYYAVWSKIGRGCGDLWFRIGDQSDTPLRSSPTLIELGNNPRIICRNCNIVNIDIDTTTVATTTFTNTASAIKPTTQLNVFVTKEGRRAEDEFPILAVVVSASGLVVVLFVILIVCGMRRRRNHSGKAKEGVLDSTRTLRREDIEHRVNVDETDKEDGTYADINEANLSPSVDTSVVPGDMYAVVHKPEKAGPAAVGEDLAVGEELAADPGSMYAQVQKSSDGKQSLILPAEASRPSPQVSRYENKDGLIYLDVEINNTTCQKNIDKQLLNESQSGCQYAEVRHK